METRTQVSASVQNVPGKLATLCEALQNADVNIEGLCCTEVGESATWHFIVDKHEAAKGALEPVSQGVTTEDVLMYACPEDKPGVIAKMAEACKNASVNIRNVYTTSPGRGQQATVYLWVNDGQIDAAKEACGSM